MKSTKRVHYSFGQFWFGSWTNITLTFTGVAAAILSGLCVPGIIILYGNLTEAFVQYKVMSELSDKNFTGPFPVGYRPFTGGLEQISSRLINQTSDFAMSSLFLAIAQWVFTSLYVLCLNQAALTQAIKARETHFKTLLNQDVDWFERQDPENLATKSIRDISYLHACFSEKLAMFVSSTVAACSCVAVALYFGPKLAGSLLTVVPIMGFIILATKKFNEYMKKKEDDFYTPAQELVEESLRNIGSVSAYGGESHECEKYVKRLDLVHDCEITKGAVNGVSGAILWAIMYCTYGFAFWYGVDLMRNDSNYSVDSLIVVFFCIQIGVLHVLQLPQYFFLISKSQAAMKKVLPNVSFEIVSGTSLVLIGPPNCGKTTCIALLHKYYDVQDGMIRFDGIDIKDIDSKWIRSHVGYAQECPVLFGSTLEECITCNIRSKNRGQMERVAKIVGVHSYVMSLPEHYNSPLTGDLPIITRQRLALARVLYRQPNILMMDNALSALSMDAEETIYDAMRNIYPDMSMLIVTNNIQLVQKVDGILYFAKDRVMKFIDVEKMIRYCPESGNIISNKSLMIDEIDLKCLSQTNAENLARRKILPCAASFLGRSYQELFKTELVRIGRYPIFFQVTDIPTTENIVQKDIQLTSARKLLLKYNRREWLPLLLAAAASAVLGCSLPIYAVLFGETLSLMSMYQGSELQVRLDFFTHMFLIAGFVSGICTVIQGYMVTVSGSKLTANMRKFSFERILQQSMEWFDCDDNDTNKICSLLKDSTPKVQQVCGQRLMFMIQAATSLTVCIFLSMSYHWKLGLATLFFSPMMLILMRHDNKLVLERSLCMSACLKNIKEIIAEAALNIKSIKSLTMEDDLLNRFREESRKLVLKQKCILQQAVVHGSCVALPGLAYAVAMFYGGYMLRRKEIEMSTVFKIAEAIILGTLMVGHLIFLTPNIMKARIATAKLVKIIESCPQDSDSKYIKKLQGSISFKDIHFHHPHYSGVPKLVNFNLQIKDGEHVAIVGLPHSGVTIPIQLLLRFYKPTSGEIYFDAEKQPNINVKFLREQIGLAEGDPVFFRRSFLDNIAYGDLSRLIKMEEIINATKTACLHDFIVSLPHGYRTIVCPSQIELTLSQKIRLSLARALIRDPKILLIQNLQRAENAEAEAILRKAILSAAINRTCIVSSHNPFSATEIFPRVVFLKRGAVAEIGSHQELLAGRGYYADLCLEIGKILPQ